MRIRQRLQPADTDSVLPATRAAGRAGLAEPDRHPDLARAPGLVNSNQHLAAARVAVRSHAAANRRHSNYLKPSTQILAHDDVFWSVTVEHAQPALAPGDPGAHATLAPRIGFDLLH